MTGNEAAQIDGAFERLEGMLQERYGRASARDGAADDAQKSED